MKIGLDIHGVIDTNPEFFSQLTQMINNSYPYSYPDGVRPHEVHIMTGSRLNNGKVQKWLKDNNIFYTHLFSISDYLKENNHKELYMSTETNPWFFDKDWNVAKADYARDHNLDLVLDDNNDYFPHFTTPIARFYSKDKK
jgi:hypothetical protein